MKLFHMTIIMLISSQCFFACLNSPVEQRDNLSSSTSGDSSSDVPLSSSLVTTSSSYQHLSSEQTQSSSSNFIKQTSNLKCVSDGFMINYNGGYLEIESNEELNYNISYFLARRLEWSTTAQGSTYLPEEPIYLVTNSNIYYGNEYRQAFSPDSAVITIDNAIRDLNTLTPNGDTHNIIPLTMKWGPQENQKDSMNLYCTLSGTPKYQWDEELQNCVDNKGNIGYNHSGWPVVYLSNNGQCYDLTQSPYQFNRFTYSNNTDRIMLKGSKILLQDSTTLVRDSLNITGVKFVDP